MASGNKASMGRDTALRSTTRELCKTARTPVLTLGGAPRKPAADPRGSDPYNTSGSFDRTKNWAGVGKR